MNAYALYLSQEEAERIYGLLSYGGNLAFVLDGYARQGIYVVTKSDAAYPRSLLKRLEQKNVPPVLFYSGNLALSATSGIAIVGSRKVDYEGVQYTKKLAGEAAANGYTMISGGAKGVDQASIDAVLEAGGSAVSFVAADMQRVIREKRTRQHIEADRLLVLSEVLPTAGFKSFNAMSRNKYIYALSKAAFVVASDKMKGGTCAGALESLKNGYADVYVWDTDRYDGNKALIDEGAKAIPAQIDWKKLQATEFVNDKKVHYQSMSLLSMVQETPGSAESNANEEKVMPMQSCAQVSEGIGQSNLEVLELDIFKIVWPILASLLSGKKPVTVKYIIERLEKHSPIVKKQIEMWMIRAVDEGLAVRYDRPVRYSLKET
ncbi:MAG: DNA-processing protein DprA [Selenomonadaceae bacterium]|nr:DNA-processing protein DprA [Selenomonadaceae bacterium]